MVKKKQSFLKRNYLESWDYLKSSRSFIWAVILIFGLFVLIGFFLPAPESFVEFMSDYLEKLTKQIEGFDSPADWIGFIFMNNVGSSFMGIIFGVFFGVFPMIATILNGYVIGFVANVAVSERGVSILWRLLPHGIFELPAIFISFGLGIKFGTFIFRKEIWVSFKNYLWNGLRVFLFIVIPLLIIASIIEGFLIFYLA